jgi:transposase
MAPKLDTVETLFTPPFGAVEGLNLRINLCMRKSNGYRSFELLQISLF